ncbi:MAG: hypothetical protein KBB70_00330 [Candidatus Pacebacteria bacterium]|nr:hypothetical protein [Candidatus Paceibacterota bacterium]
MTQHNQKGFATLMAVLIVGAVGAAFAVSFLNKGIQSSKNTISIQHAYQSKLLADQCAELGLQEIRNVTTYVGSGSSSNAAGTCTYEVVELGGNRRNITGIGKSGDATKKVLVEIDGINPEILIISWREVL